MSGDLKTNLCLAGGGVQGVIGDGRPCDVGRFIGPGRSGVGETTAATVEEGGLGCGGEQWDTARTALNSGTLGGSHIEPSPEAYDTEGFPGWVKKKQKLGEQNITIQNQLTKYSAHILSSIS